MSNIQTPEFRVSFPQVFKPKAPPGSDKEKYSVQMLFDKSKMKSDPKQKKLWKGLKQALKDAATTKWGDKVPENLADPFRDGADKNFDGYGPGIIYMNATTTTKPGLVDQNVDDIIRAEDFYPGCYAHATVNAYAWEFMKKKGVSFGLQNIQKIKDGTPFGVGRTSPDDEFEALDTDDLDGDDDLDDDDDDMLS